MIFGPAVKIFGPAVKTEVKRNLAKIKQKYANADTFL